MPDVIQLLSDHIANQIAAGEVIQRPASAVKELLENAVDAGATEIQLVVRDAGKELVQVIDNGKGMSVTDARMSFERHATSKIRNIDDLFTIRTMGFRGEALASIAAVAQVEMKTRQHDAEVGTRICVEATDVKLQEPAAAAPGTNIMVKNLFYNVPARRHFLKSNTTEFRHILDEFTRVALAHPKIAFRLWHNNVEQFHLEAGNLKTRIIGLLGNSFEKNMVPVEENTELINISGFIGKPEAATRTRGMQFFFINNRFIRSSFLNHAIMTAYEGLIEKEAFPFYVLFLDVDPSRVDVNVHPTKQEVKFDDDRMMYAYLHATAKHALARYNIAPSLDFTLNSEVMQLPAIQMPHTQQTMANAQKSYLFNTFSQKNQAHFVEHKEGLQRWKELYEIAEPGNGTDGGATQGTTIPSQSATLLPENENVPSSGRQNNLLVQGSMLVTTVRSGLMLIHIRRAQERIWFERLLQQWNAGNTPSQQVLFPASYEMPPQDCILLTEVLPDLARIGFDISPFGQNTFVVQGVPTDLPAGEEKNVLDEVLDQLKHESHDAVASRTERILMQMARRLSRNKHAIQQPEGQQALIDELFACSQPEYTPDGKKVFMMLRKEELDDMLG
ncbi:DNA mismatch repair endonuclease MutL [Taibaiella soli]|uniref:DNA mismatch repair protein MutL n=1 Tax=Taibaiella soli TaxID=1649169 RepID=A0A2W2ABX7_9BACT|nr:DNA mismatch repair endonuclease MutL [Taibaiella soli]PZF72791.1 DNA mismatch repair endonuclease MutL [Taibaiella soli]